MNDFAFSNPDGTGFDFAHDGTDLIVGDGLLTALIHSVFRDARAPEGMVGPDTDPRGHWASELQDNAPDGSWLWLLGREKITPDMPHRVADYLEQCCRWMIAEITGPTASVTNVRAFCQKAARRGRIEGTLDVILDREPFNRRFVIVYDIVVRQYELKEI